jgi:tRNA-2-methylthio-N6-dimethylallyladenosine synthase
MRVFLETFGCQMNILDSELVEGQFKKAGYSFVNNPDDANIVLINTCSVRKVSENKALSLMGKLKCRKEKGEDLVVGVLGCMAERTHDELSKAKPFIDVMVGPSKIHDTLSLVEEALKKDSKNHKTKKSLSYFVNRKGNKESALLSPFDDLEALDRLRPLDNRSSPWQAYVRITRGCNKFCSFCVVPRTRGPEMHRPPLSIIDEVKNLVDSGALEITLLGQTINHYFYDEPGKKWSFADLLFNIHEQVPGLKRLRFLTSYPRDFTDEALDVMKSCDRISKYLHIPAQSGSNKVLREMNRGYDVETYLDLIERAKSRMPNISLLGDMIVGFPNESEEDFELSLELLRKVRYKNLFIFKYSPRPNTVALKKFEDNIPLDIKKRRNNIMLEVQNNIALELNLSMIGNNYNILCESTAKLDRLDHDISLVTLRSNKDEVNLTGRTTGDHIVHFRGSQSLIGSLVDVKITQARMLSLDAVINQS